MSDEDDELKIYLTELQNVAKHVVLEVKKAGVEKTAPPMQAVKIEPPRQAEAIILALMEKGAADALLGDLEEMFHADLASGMTVSRANWRYWGQIARSLWPLIWEAAKRTGVFVAFVKLLG